MTAGGGDPQDRYESVDDLGDKDETRSSQFSLPSKLSVRSIRLVQSEEEDAAACDDVSQELTLENGVWYLTGRRSSSALIW